MKNKFLVLMVSVFLPLLGLSESFSESFSESYSPEMELAEGKILAVEDQAKESLVSDMKKSLAKMNFEFDELAVYASEESMVESMVLGDEKVLLPILSGLSQIIFQAENIISELSKNRTLSYKDSEAKYNEFKSLQSDYDQALKTME